MVSDEINIIVQKTVMDDPGAQLANKFQSLCTTVSNQLDFLLTTLDHYVFIFIRICEIFILYLNENIAHTIYRM